MKPTLVPPERIANSRGLAARRLATGLIVLGLVLLGAVNDDTPGFETASQERFAPTPAARGEPIAPPTTPAANDPMSAVETYIANRPGKTGVHSLETGADALRARAWLVDNARRSIEVQYFIWSPDNIGTLAAEALLRAADRGVKVRVIVDDLLIDAQERTLVSLVAHPNVEVRIYNPRHKVGVRWYQRVWHMLTDFRGFNQRMHDKSFIVDGKVAIIGGRNMAAEYYDFSHEYNFRDRDALVLGQVVREIGANFENFWASPLSQPVARLLEQAAGRDKLALPGAADVARFRTELTAYAASPENFEPEIRQSIRGTPGEFDRLGQAIHWGDVQFIHDSPGKNVSGRFVLDGGGKSAEALASLFEGAREDVVIQSPYLVLSDQAQALFEKARARGVRIRVNTNSLAATDNLEAFSGYLWQRKRLLAIGVEIHEFRPDAAVQRELMRPYLRTDRPAPKASLHAKTMVVDGATAFIGTYNLDPRSQNLNTEIGIVVHDKAFAGRIHTAILHDMESGNSWNAASDDPDLHAPSAKRWKARIYSWLPLRAIL